MNEDSPTYWDKPARDCPQWCCGDHEGQYHPEDAIHTTCLPSVPVILRTRRFPTNRWDQVDLWSQDHPLGMDLPDPFAGEHDLDPGAEEVREAWNPNLSPSHKRGSLVDEATYFDVIRMQWVAGGDEWLFVGDSNCSWLVTVESARRIFRAMAQVL